MINVFPPMVIFKDDATLIQMAWRIRITRTQADIGTQFNLNLGSELNNFGSLVIGQ